MNSSAKQISPTMSGMVLESTRPFRSRPTPCLRQTTLRNALRRDAALVTLMPEGVDFPGGMKGFTGAEVTAGEVGDGQWIAVAAIGQHELALGVGTSQLIGRIAGR
jgi:hypothetical protein